MSEITKKINDEKSSVDSRGAAVDEIISNEYNPGAKDGQEKCPKCGATDISLNPTTGLLRCNFCRHEFEPMLIHTEQKNLYDLEEKIISSGASDIDNSNSMITLKCESCGAEVVIDTEQSTQARCHWCRNTLSIQNKVPNGAVPDMVLPFSVKKSDAEDSIRKFVEKRSFFAHPTFKKEFTTENIMGVYFPYMLVDLNTHAEFAGIGEHEAACYQVEIDDDNTETVYDVDEYRVFRTCDATIEDLSIESNSDIVSKDRHKTNNIINAIMPFDTENCVHWNSNYIKGFSSEKRDLNTEHLSETVHTQTKDIIKFGLNKSVTYYDRGVRWDEQNVEVKGERWSAAYLPVWLYSYQEKKSKDDYILHYIAVNARTKETMGSIPLHMPKLLGVTAIIELIAAIAMIFIKFDYDWLLLLIGVIFFASTYFSYRNTGERHRHEIESKVDIRNIDGTDDFIRRSTGVSDSSMSDANNTTVDGAGIMDKLKFINKL